MFEAGYIARRALLAAACAVFAGCALAQGAGAAHDDGSDQSAAAKAGSRLPPQQLSEAVLYEYLMGEVAAQRGSPGLAAQMFVDLARRTHDPRIARRAVEFAGAAHEPKRALEAAKLWNEADPNSRQALRVLVSLLVVTNRVEDAEPYMEKLLAGDTASAAAGYLQLDRLLASNPDKAANLRLVKRLVERRPKLAQAQFALGQATLAAGDEPGALKAIRHAAKLAPDWSLPALFEAQMLQDKSPAKAADRLARYLDAHPKDRQVRLSYARLLVGAKRYAEARAQFEKLLASQPDNPDALYAVGLLAHQMKQYSVAEASLKRVLELGYRNPDAVRFELGQIAEEQDKWDQAVQWYESVQPGTFFLSARFRVAQGLANRGRLEDARRYLHKLDEAHGDLHVPIVVAEAQLLRDAKRAQDAYDVLGAALRKQPDQPELLYDFALTAEKLGHFDVLEKNLRRLIQLRPDDAQAYNALGYSLADRNMRLPEARKLIEKALALSPHDSFIVDSMGWVLYRQGDVKGAIGWLRRAYGERPDAEIGAHLGEALWMSGAHDEARRIWNEALQLHPDNDALQKTIERFKP